MSLDQPDPADAVGTLKVRIAELEQEQRDLRLFKQVVTSAPDGVVLATIEGRICFTNHAWNSMVDLAEGGQGRLLAEFLAQSDRNQFEADLTTISVDKSWYDEWTFLRADGTTFPGLITINVISDEHDLPTALVANVRDLRERRAAEEQRLVLQEQLIAAQREALREVSTPLIPLAKDVLVMPLVGAIDSSRAQQIMEVLLEGIALHQAEIVLLDISGVHVVDTQVADALLRAARAVQLLGARIILTGISAEVAQTIVHLGADMSRIMTRANLQDGLHYALEERPR